MLNTTPGTLKVMFDLREKYHRAIREATNEPEREKARAAWAKLDRAYYDERHHHANEILLGIDGEDAIAVLFCRLGGYGISIVTADGVEEYGPYKTEENAIRYASKKHRINPENVIAESGYEFGLRDAKAAIADAAEAAMVSMRDDVIAEQGNSEDAVNVLAYEAYQIVYGETSMCDMDVELMDELLVKAAWHVETRCEYCGIEWEEYRW